MSAQRVEKAVAGVAQAWHNELAAVEQGKECSRTLSPRISYGLCGFAGLLLLRVPVTPALLVEIEICAGQLVQGIQHVLVADVPDDDLRTAALRNGMLP